jgi:hypothetical protein
MQLNLRHDPEHCIPVPFVAQTAGERAAWARETAAAFATRRELAPAVATRIAAALEDVAAVTTDESRSLVIVGIEGRAIAPLTVFAVDERLSEDDQAAFLWSTSALLPATTEILETEGFGVGISVTLLERHGDRDFGFERWLFLGEETTVAAILGPVAPYALAFVEEPAKAVLSTSTLEGFVPSTDRARVEALDRAVVRFGEDWPA